MPDVTQLVNLALQSFGSRTTVTAAELVANSTNESIQANLTFANTRDSLLRMAPWDCGLKTANLVYITSVPGTTQNPSPSLPLWAPGIPRPPWAYEYQYPVDCLRACWIIPASQTGFTGVPITTAVTGNTPTTWLGAPIVFKVGIDQFWAINGLAVTNPGVGYNRNEIITTSVNPNSTTPVGAPALVRVLTVDGAGGILTIELVNQVIDSFPLQSGSYLQFPVSPLTQASSNNVGTGATFTIASFANTTLSGDNKGDQRVILTNQEYATLCYVRQVTDPNIWDSLFQDAFTNALGADLCMALVGDKSLANMLRVRANETIGEARKADGNEGLTINDVVPDWIRIRGINFDSPYQGNGSFDWGGVLPLFG